MDLVRDLLKSEEKPTITVFMDRLSKMVHFASYTKETSVEKYAQFFYDYVFKHYSLPKVIIFDGDPRFTSCFGKELIQKHGTNLKFNVALQSQIDGQSEVMIKMLERLRLYIGHNPHTWVQ